MLNTAQAATVTPPLEAAFVAKGGTAGAIPWATIIAIFSQIISGCIPSPTPPKIKETVADDQAREPAVRLAMIELFGFGGYRRHNGAAVSASLKEVAPTMPDEIFAAVVD